ncbi:type VI secretion system accessory protein TagJ [Roseospira visakhapatnamensis]|uniref:Type VI secretion system protein ImpE n=1 Tax=Roseospira visakhapatnamensis TaxID=390880 RepID=A0A7W6W842_9PROT|nr:type VI secretion system accessory protein TagJ [Roseospira visakhapatnamensis]MBB4264439.1 type VI secretion system protein ImpE [Roseospira visakhapatnamensis]
MSSTIAAATEHYQAGRLGKAIETLNAVVKSKPLDLDARGLLATLLCFDGNLERADLMLDVIGKQTPELTVALALARQLIRAETHRQAVFAEGAVPELLHEPPPWMTARLKAGVALREGAVADATRLLAEAEDARPAVAGTLDGTAFGDWRDADDTCAGFMEVLTSTGKYYWVPAERIRSMAFRAPKRPQDLLWRQCEMTVEDGPEGEVFIPVLYPGTARLAADQEGLKLGRATDWVGDEATGAPVRGLGQRCMLVGEDLVPVMSLGEMDFTPAAAA